jgi:NADH:ubiquinone oxidoreductase subunit 6 (subunit J)
MIPKKLSFLMRNHRRSPTALSKSTTRSITRTVLIICLAALLLSTFFRSLGSWGDSGDFYQNLLVPGADYSSKSLPLGRTGVDSGGPFFHVLTMLYKTVSDEPLLGFFWTVTAIPALFLGLAFLLLRRGKLRETVPYFFLAALIIDGPNRPNDNLLSFYVAIPLFLVALDIASGNLSRLKAALLGALFGIALQLHLTSLFCVPGILLAFYCGRSSLRPSHLGLFTVAFTASMALYWPTFPLLHAREFSEVSGAALGVFRPGNPLDVLIRAILFMFQPLVLVSIAGGVVGLRNPERSGSARFALIWMAIPMAALCFYNADGWAIASYRINIVAGAVCVLWAFAIQTGSDWLRLKSKWLSQNVQLGVVAMIATLLSIAAIGTMQLPESDAPKAWNRYAATAYVQIKSTDLLTRELPPGPTRGNVPRVVNWLKLARDPATEVSPNRLAAIVEVGPLHDPQSELERLGMRVSTAPDISVAMEPGQGNWRINLPRAPYDCFEAVFLAPEGCAREPVAITIAGATKGETLAPRGEPFESWGEALYLLRSANVNRESVLLAVESECEWEPVEVFYPQDCRNE